MIKDNWEVPKYDKSVFFEKVHRHAICVFVLNEGEKFQKQIIEMRSLSGRLDIIIADGGSTDRAISNDFLQANNVRALLIKTDEGKLSAQMRMAFAYCLDEGYEGIITIDGNNKDNPLQAERFILALDEGYDHVQGSRFISGGQAIRTPFSRLLGIRLLHAPLISIAAGYHYTDTTNGFRAYSRRLLLDPWVAPFRDIFSNYELHYYLAIRAAQLGYNILEVPVTREYPAEGKTPTKISPIKGNYAVLKALVNAVFHKYDPEVEVEEI